tara:strand:+ start:497 stop:1456 length:960 start_codon:yes stop_codon:yes gene_type:complete
MFNKKNIAKQNCRKYVCKYCNYKTDDKRDYNKHLERKKHLKNVKIWKKNEKNLNDSIKKKCDSLFQKFICIYCDKSYSHASGLSKHKKKCLILNNIIKNNENKKELKDNENEKLKKENEELKTMLTKLLSTQTESLTSNAINQVTNNNNTINNNIYNKMSVNIFLNEKCKNAMNLTDFVNQITISLADLEYTKDNGFAKGITNILTKQLQDLNPTERPIHCSDKKRLQFYVKDEGKWEKDENHKKLDKSIHDVQKAQIKKMYDWEQMHPGWKTKPHLVEEWSKIVHGLTGSGADNEKSTKEIKRNISSHIDVKEELMNK